MPLKKTDKIWMNGEFVNWDDAKIHVLTHALHYGSGVFEGIRCYSTVKGPAIFRLKEHMDRLINSGKIYYMKIPYTSEELCKVAKELIKINKQKEGYIRPIAFYGYGEMGVNPLKNEIITAMATWSWGAYLGEDGLKKGIRCTISSWRRIDSQILPPQAKACGNYLNSILAKVEALRAGYDEAIVMNIHGYIAEGSGENIFLVKNEEIATPPLEAGILPGITRASVIQIAKDLDMDIVERNISREELFLADEVFLTGTAAEVTPVREIDGRLIGRGERGETAGKIQEKFFDIVKGKDERYSLWLDPVE